MSKLSLSDIAPYRGLQSRVVLAPVSGYGSALIMTVIIQPSSSRDNPIEPLKGYSRFNARKVFIYVHGGPDSQELYSRIELILRCRRVRGCTVRCMVHDGAEQSAKAPVSSVNWKSRELWMHMGPGISLCYPSISTLIVLNHLRSPLNLILIGPAIMTCIHPAVKNFRREAKHK
ncbi:hypothetical protein R3P38DRAFT_2805646 [Favolaschia claudopus]|uniref:Alpha/beta hydrolase n=1 Tax=Favolaschia claudopus TaxID=2862362 RepID=A0AAV9ZLZ5_9AGAR